MRSPMGDGARRLALGVGTFKVAARRTLRGVVWFAANPGVTGDVTTVGGGVGGSGGEGGPFMLVWKGRPKDPPRERRRRTPAPRACCASMTGGAGAAFGAGTRLAHQLVVARR